MKRGYYKYILVAVVVIFWFVQFYYDANKSISNANAIDNNFDNTKKISIVAVGDIMFHIPQVKNAYNGKTYDFSGAFKDIRSELQAADITVGNYEAVTLPARRLSGFPRFNVPEETIDAIKYAGFDVLSIANNHIMDYEQVGLISTKRLINKRGILTIGAGEKKEKKYTIINKNGIKVGFLAYTFGTNYKRAEKNTLNYIDIKRIKQDLVEIKRLCDFTIVYLHSGTEYVREVEDGQRKLCRRIADLGADCVLNSHPHVARESEVYETNGKNVFINYSMGNFLSNQNDKYTDIGLVIKLSVTKNGSLTKLTGNEVIPVYRLRYMNGTKMDYRIVLCNKIDEYKDKMNQDMLSYVKDLNDRFYMPDVYQAFNGN